MSTLAIWMLYRHTFGLGRLSSFWLVWIRHDLVCSSMIWLWNCLIHDTYVHIQLVGFGLVIGCYPILLGSLACGPDKGFTDRDFDEDI